MSLARTDPGAASIPLVTIHADESCLGNGRDGSNPGGAGGIVEYRPEPGELVRRDYWLSEPATTNNRMALRSVIEGFHAISARGSRFRVIFTSDSRYLIDGLSDWVYGWSERGWKRKGGAIENLDLWRDAIATLLDGGHLFEWRWVRGHQGHPQNEYANYLATRAARDQSTSNGLVASEFENWLSQQKRKLEPEPFPASSSFKAAPRLPPPPLL